MKDYDDWTESIDILGSEIMVPFDIQGATIMMPFDVQGATIMMPVDFQGQTVDVKVNITAQTIEKIAVDITAQTIGNLNVNIASSAATLNVNISGQIGNVNINVSAQAVGIYLQPEWAASQNLDKNISNYTQIQLNTGAYVITYTVTAGKTLYINQFSALAYEGGATPASIGMRATLEVPGGTVVFSLGGMNGCGHTFPKPFKALSGQTVRLYVLGYSSSTGILYGTINGYEI